MEPKQTIPAGNLRRVGTDSRTAWTLLVAEVPYLLPWLGRSVR